MIFGKSRWRRELEARLQTLEEYRDQVLKLDQQTSQMKSEQQSRSHDINQALHTHSVFIKELLGDRDNLLKEVGSLWETIRELGQKLERLEKAATDPDLVKQDKRIYNLETVVLDLQHARNDLDNRLEAFQTHSVHTARQFEEQVSTLAAQTQPPLPETYDGPSYAIQDVVTRHKQTTGSTVSTFRLRAMIGDILDRHEVASRGMAGYVKHASGMSLRLNPEGFEFVLHHLKQLDPAKSLVQPEAKPSQVIAVSPLFACVMVLVDESGGRWVGLASDILRQFPNLGMAASSVTKALRAGAQELFEKTGIACEFQHTGYGTRITLQGSRVDKGAKPQRQKV